MRREGEFRIKDNTKVTTRGDRVKKNIIRHRTNYAISFSKLRASLSEEERRHVAVGITTSSTVNSQTEVVS